MRLALNMAKQPNGWLSGVAMAKTQQRIKKCPAEARDETK
jgi:hypothetical protein